MYVYIIIYVFLSVYIYTYVYIYMYIFLYVCNTDCVFALVVVQYPGKLNGCKKKTGTTENWYYFLPARPRVLASEGLQGYPPGYHGNGKYPPLMDDFPIKTSIYTGFPIFDYRSVLNYNILQCFQGRLIRLGYWKTSAFYFLLWCSGWCGWCGCCCWFW